MPAHESHWLVMQRCLAIVRRLQRGPASREELIEAVCECLGSEAYPEAEVQARGKRFHNDLRRLRDRLDIEVQFDHKTGVYVLTSPGSLALLDLPDPALDAMGFLIETFDEQAPHYEKIRTLLDTLTGFFSDERRRDLMRRRNLLQVDLRRTDADEIDSDVQVAVERACVERRRLEFGYVSPSQEDQQPRCHEVEPYELLYRRKHYYLRGFCLQTDGPKGKYTQERIMYYRLGRIVPDSVKLLPQKIPLVPRRAPKYLVRYELQPEIARRGVTHYFEDTVVEMRENGSALVQGYADDIFWASRELLYYGAGCRVLGGSEILREMRKLVEGMARVYGFVPEN